MSGSPEEISNVLDVVNRTEYMRGYNARNEELKKDPARLNIEINHGYYKTGYLQGQYDMMKKVHKAIEEIFLRKNSVVTSIEHPGLKQALEILNKHMEGKE